MRANRSPIARLPHALRRVACAATLGSAALFAAPFAAQFALLPAAHAANLPGPGVAWLQAGTDAEVDRAFAQAKAEGKPLLLYWGASWCPPCNQLKATLFNRQDFIDRARGFTVVHVDGDLPGAQKIGARFKVSGYPTLLLMSPQGQEITRLPGEADPEKVLAVMEQGLAGGRPARAVLADAKAGKALTPAEWRMLAYYSWGTDQAQLVPAAERPGLLAQLANQVPATDPATATRLMLMALSDSDDGKGVKADAALRERILKLLADPKASRAQADMIVNSAADITRGLAPQAGADRDQVRQAFETALERLRQDTTLSRADRSSAMGSLVQLARIDQPKDALHPKMPAALVERAKAHAQADDREIQNLHERQAVITGDAWMLGQAGEWAASDALLKGGLDKSPAPYYLMSQLAGNARKQGRNVEALQWSEKAWTTSQGPATRLQWGANHLSMLVDLTPKDTPRIEKVAHQIFDEAAKDPGAFHERSAAVLRRVAAKLKGWGKTGSAAAAVERLGKQVEPICGKLDAADPQRKACDTLFQAKA